MIAWVVESESVESHVFSWSRSRFFFKLLESESGFQKCWSRFFKTAGVGVRSRNPKKSSDSTTLLVSSASSFCSTVDAGANADCKNVQLVMAPHCLQGLCQEGHPVDNGKQAPIKVPEIGTIQDRCAN